MVNTSAERTVGELEDDFHHFRVELTHDGRTIVGVHATPLRGPWSTCMEVGTPLREIEGGPLSVRSTAIGGYATPTHNCTHLFDLTGLVVAHATRDERRRQYDIAMTDLRDEGRTLAIWRNGELVLRWDLEGDAIVEPQEWITAPIHAKFIPWAETQLDLDLAEAAIALRRMLHISMGRSVDLDEATSGADHDDGPIGRCYSYQPEVLVRAIRRKRSVRDFTDPRNAALLLADMDVRG